MKADSLRGMVKRTVKMYGNKVSEEDIDYILDLCDDNYETELVKIIEAQKRINEIFLLALGRKKFDEIKSNEDK